MFRFLRKPFPMTDEEIINKSLKAVNEYAKEHKGDNFDIEESVKCAVKAIELEGCKTPRTDSEAIAGFGTEGDYPQGEAGAGTAGKRTGL